MRTHWKFGNFLKINLVRKGGANISAEPFVVLIMIMENWSNHMQIKTRCVWKLNKHLVEVKPQIPIQTAKVNIVLSVKIILGI